MLLRQPINLHREAKHVGQGGREDKGTQSEAAYDRTGRQGYSQACLGQTQLT